MTASTVEITERISRGRREGGRCLSLLFSHDRRAQEGKEKGITLYRVSFIIITCLCLRYVDDKEIKSYLFEVKITNNVDSY